MICPAGGLDAEGTLVIEGDAIAGFHAGTVEAREGDRVLDARGLVVAPGFIDLHAHLGEPGFEHREDLESGTLAAVRGGFTAVCTDPGTLPPNDHRALTERLVARGRELGRARVLPVAAATVGRKGDRLTEMFDLRDGGAVAFGDGGRSIRDAGLLRRAMEYARAVGAPIFEFPEDPTLVHGGVMHEGPVATRLGLKGVPAAAEEIGVWRAVALARQTGARVHVGPISTAGAVRGIRLARAEGLPVSCAVTAAHLHLTDEAIAESTYDTCLRVRPPLRPQADVEALRGAVAEGLVDAVSSGHRPQAEVDKALEFDLAEPGMIGLETTLGLVLRLVDAGRLTLGDAVARLTAGPAAVLGSELGSLRAGATADVVVFDPVAKVRIEAGNLASRARNTPFLGQAMPGRVVWTVVGGRMAYAAEEGR